MTREWERVSEAERQVILPFLTDVPVRIASIARALGVEVKSATLKPRISGQIQRSETSASGYRIRVNRHEAATRQRFTIAHEIGHYLLHRDAIGDGIEDTILYRSTLSDRREAEANKMAAELLMPRDRVLASLQALGGRATKAVASQMADQFEVSEAAMKVRLGIA
ncbi:ImmA/IrrE family metallo-endopeptidase [Tritonibacter scottomollicae]|uniref:ImmA/IrrE family metallo-endopeptidase n=1 Tax=Tritonibacter scottomollicae TaxID=483013 RepID=UPI003AA8EF5C